MVSITCECLVGRYDIDLWGLYLESGFLLVILRISLKTEKAGFIDGIFTAKNVQQIIQQKNTQPKAFTVRKIVTAQNDRLISNSKLKFKLIYFKLNWHISFLNCTSWCTDDSYHNIHYYFFTSSWLFTFSSRLFMSSRWESDARVAFLEPQIRSDRFIRPTVRPLIDTLVFASGKETDWLSSADARMATGMNRSEPEWTGSNRNKLVWTGILMNDLRAHWVVSTIYDKCFATRKNSWRKVEIRKMFRC